jgi:hypothetical protein
MAVAPMPATPGSCLVIRRPHAHQRISHDSRMRTIEADPVDAVEMPIGRGGDALDGDVRLRHSVAAGTCAVRVMPCFGRRMFATSISHAARPPPHRRRRGDRHTLGGVGKSHPWPWSSPPTPTATNTWSRSTATAGSARFKLPRRVGFTDVLQRNPTGKGPNECARPVPARRR